MLRNERRMSRHMISVQLLISRNLKVLRFA